MEPPHQEVRADDDEQRGHRRSNLSPQENEQGKKEINPPLHGNGPHDVVNPSRGIAEKVLHEENMAPNRLSIRRQRDIPMRLGFLSDDSPNQQERESQCEIVRRQ